jgi:hypothetical protein
MSDTSTAASFNSDSRNTRTADGFWHSMHLYIADMPSSPSQRQKLKALVDRTKTEWETILSENENSDTEPATVIPSHAEPLGKEKHLNSYDHIDRKDQLRDLCKELLQALLFPTSRLPLSELLPTTTLHLSRDYIFTASLSPKLPICSVFGVSKTVEVSMIRFPGRKVRAVNVGVCSQLDSQIFFGEDGGIYLVEADLVFLPAELEGGIQIFDSDQYLDNKWYVYCSLEM